MGEATVAPVTTTQQSVGLKRSEAIKLAQAFGEKGIGIKARSENEGDEAHKLIGEISAHDANIENLEAQIAKLKTEIAQAKAAQEAQGTAQSASAEPSQATKAAEEPKTAPKSLTPEQKEVAGLKIDINRLISEMQILKLQQSHDAATGISFEEINTKLEELQQELETKQGELKTYSGQENSPESSMQPKSFKSVLPKKDWDAMSPQEKINYYEQSRIGYNGMIKLEKQKGNTDGVKYWEGKVAEVKEKKAALSNPNAPVEEEASAALTEEPANTDTPATDAAPAPAETSDDDVAPAADKPAEKTELTPAEKQKQITALESDINRLVTEVNELVKLRTDYSQYDDGTGNFDNEVHKVRHWGADAALKKSLEELRALSPNHYLLNLRTAQFKERQVENGKTPKNWGAMPNAQRIGILNADIKSYKKLMQMESGMKTDDNKRTSQAEYWKDVIEQTESEIAELQASAK